MPQKRPSQKSATSPRTTKILALHEKGLSLTTIGERLGLSRQAVSRHVSKADAQRRREREGKTSEEVTLGKLFELSSSNLLAQLEEGTVTNSNTLLAIAKESHDRLHKIQTAPAQNFIAQLFDSVKDQMVSITLGIQPVEGKKTESPPIQINPAPVSDSASKSNL